MRWAVEELIPEGVTVFAGKAKSGKSWAALGLALSVADGAPVFGRFTVQRGSVLYLALEDSPAGEQRRLRKLLRARDEMPTGLLHIENSWPTAEEGGIEEIESWLSDFPDARLVVIDVMRRFDPIGYSYSKDSKKVEKLGDLGRRRHVGIILVMHMYKGPAVSASSPDWMDKIQGSVGVSGAADCIMGLARERGTDEGVLRVVGRDVPEQNVAMTFNPESGVWLANESGGEFAAVLSEERQRIYRAVEQYPGLTAVEVAKQLSCTYNTIRHLAWSMVKAEQLVKRDGHYYTPPQVEAIEAPDPSPQMSFVERERIDFVPGELTQALGPPLNTVVTANRDNGARAA